MHMSIVQSEHAVGSKPQMKNEKEAHALFHLWHKEGDCPYYWNTDMVSPYLFNFML